MPRANFPEPMHNDPNRAVNTGTYLAVAFIQLFNAINHIINEMAHQHGKLNPSICAAFA